MSDSFERKPVSEWFAESVRVTAFLKPGSITPEDWWKTIFSEDAENVQITRSMKTYQGKCPGLNHWLLIQSQKNRVDFIHLAAPGQDLSELGIGPIESTIHGFFELILPVVIEHVNQASRVALGVETGLSVGSREDCYRQLSAYLPFQLATDASDFLYQINRRQGSKNKDGTQINCLRKYTVAQKHFVLGQISSEMVQFDTSDSSGHYCNLALDVNTVPNENVYYSGSETNEFLQEFANIALAFIGTGDKSP